MMDKLIKDMRKEITETGAVTKATLLQFQLLSNSSYFDADSKIGKKYSHFNKDIREVFVTLNTNVVELKPFQNSKNVLKAGEMLYELEKVLIIPRPRIACGRDTVVVVLVSN